MEKTFGAEHLRVAGSLGSLGSFLIATGRTAEARGVFARALAIVEKGAGADSFRAAEALWGLARCCRLSGEQEEALKYLARAESLCEKEGESDVENRINYHPGDRGGDGEKAADRF
jgi:tetratricopeptide (TPR) repeat protein